MTYREREVAARLQAAQMARDLAHKSRIMAEIWPKYRDEEMAEYHRHFARAYEHLDRARLLRATQ